MENIYAVSAGLMIIAGPGKVDGSEGSPYIFFKGLLRREAHVRMCEEVVVRLSALLDATMFDFKSSAGSGFQEL